MLTVRLLNAYCTLTVRLLHVLFTLAASPNQKVVCALRARASVHVTYITQWMIVDTSYVQQLSLLVESLLLNAWS